MQRIIEQLTAEARTLDAQEESLVTERIQLRNTINAARLATFRIAEIQRQLEALKIQQIAVESQLVEAQLEQVMKSGNVIFLKGTKLGGSN